MSSKDRKKIIYILTAVLALVFLFINYSVSLGIILGFLFCFINLKLVYKAMEDTFEKTSVSLFSKNLLLRFVLLAVFIFLSVYFAPYFSFAGITIGMVMALFESLCEERKVR
ncbi:MAG: ATP synthase subunit I [Erysipelotrichaceae bacterium]|nr:ATP synthase subunit I [Erysipelotrichaceae bacterium]